MPITSLEQFITDMSWNTLDFTDKQLEQIYTSIDSSYTSFNQLNEELELSANEDAIPYFTDCGLAETLGYLNDLQDVEMILAVLTTPYGYNGTSASLYYLSADDLYCLIMHN